MFNRAITLLLIFLILFTPIAFGAMELWAFSVMELGILLIIILWSLQSLIPRTPNSPPVRQAGGLHTFNPPLKILNSPLTIVLLSLFLLLFLFLFIFLLRWKPLEQGNRTTKRLIVVVMMAGVLESLYGMFEFFSGHRHILHLEAETFVSSVTGTFINRNYLAGYLLMVIPVSIGFLFSREVVQGSRYGGWRERLSSLDGKTLLIGFSVIVMILGLIFTASRMGILSLLLSFSLISFLFRNPEKGKRFSKTAVLIFGLALLWAAWIGLDAVISRFFSVSEGFEGRWKIWVDTFQIFKDFPIVGSGLGTFMYVFPGYRSFHIRGLVNHAENDFLQLLSDVGLIGIGLLLLVFVFLFFRAVLAIRSFHSSDSEKYIAIGGLVGILALMFHSLVERNIQVPANAFLYTVLWAIVLKVSLNRKVIDKS